MEGDNQEWTDWVADLFQPQFSIDLEGKEKERPPDPEIDIPTRVHHVSPYDPDAIRRVYEKVHMTIQLSEEMRSQSPSPKKKREETSPVVGPDSQSALRKSKETEDLRESCIWNSDELESLRHFFKTVKQQNVELTVTNREVMKRNKVLEGLLATQKHTIESQKEKLKESRKANQRFKIHCESLQSELDHAIAKTGALEEILKELKQEKANMMQEYHDNKVLADKERLERERIQIRLDGLKKEALTEKITAEESIKAMCRQVILDLQEKVKNLTLELETERQTHKNTQKGLNHLRHHFSSLSVQDILPPNAVDKDQVDRIDY